MIRSIVTILFLISSSPLAMANCSDDTLGASYKITTSDLDGRHSKVNHLVLWRKGNQVIHEHKETRITEVWDHLKNGQLRLARNFNNYKRGIEYEPNEIKIKHSRASWELKKQLITQSLMDNMMLVATSENGCATQQQYENKNSQDKISQDKISQNKVSQNKVSLQWLVKQKLVKKLTIESSKEKVSWELLSLIKDKKQVIKTFRTYAEYKMTDYTDIGDNESDPFLAKMINMGFVSHSASGMYDQNGNAIEGAHQH